ncbi:MAG: helix-turn-helix domain-containing protein [Senegalia sp. (in: firmicutes)]|uniref:helix-turn-helix domain-containing protein n=1 Tax=Senegalia sp. (in: firmicutes) TaxID=1924098 RepID=UPI003F9DA316
MFLKRITCAKDELYCTDNHITNIPLNSGFNSQSNFIRLFKKKESIIPLKFRKYYRESGN